MRSRTRPARPATWSGFRLPCRARRPGLIRYVRRGPVTRTHECRPWWLLGVVVVATHPPLTTGQEGGDGAAD